MSGDELVLGVPRARLMPSGSWRGGLHGDLAPCLELFAHEGHFRRRDEAETDPEWKQVIPYLVLRDRGSLFLMRRTRAGSDARLHERYSIGIGGHVNPADGGLDGGLARGGGGENDAGYKPGVRAVGRLDDDTHPGGPGP